MIKIDDKLKDSIQESIREFKYGLFGILQNNPKIRINPVKKQVLLTDIYRYDESAREGTCAELMNTAYIQLKKNHPGLYFFRADGNESKFFPTPPASHSFIFACHDEHTVEKLRRYEPAKINEEHFIVIDPSFGLITPYVGSGYSLRKLYNEGVPVDYVNSELLSHGHGIPISRFGKGLLHLFARFDLEDVLCFGISLPGEKGGLFGDGIYGDTIDGFIDDLAKVDKFKADEINSLVTKIRSIEPKRTFWHLKDISRKITVS